MFLRRDIAKSTETKTKLSLSMIYSQRGDVYGDIAYQSLACLQNEAGFFEKGNWAQARWPRTRLRQAEAVFTHVSCLHIFNTLLQIQIEVHRDGRKINVLHFMKDSKRSQKKNWGTHFNVSLEYNFHTKMQGGFRGQKYWENNCRITWTKCCVLSEQGPSSLGKELQNLLRETLHKPTININELGVFTCFLVHNPHKQSGR